MRLIHQDPRNPYTLLFNRSLSIVNINKNGRRSGSVVNEFVEPRIKCIFCGNTWPNINGFFFGGGGV